MKWNSGNSMATDINDLKRQIFFEMLDLSGRVFILVNHAEDVVIGNRGFLPEEKEKGIILVFNKRMNFEWGDEAISARLVFGATTEKCYIPVEEVLSVFSPELAAQFSVTPPSEPRVKNSAGERPEQGRTDAAAKEGKVVKVDFNKKR
ncbi:MAG: ClpXP protease specificity-enhancing factor SspB [Nitrospiraceae bacterium]|nr:ClpXP protease specificity-enhancing factor SspB [Nitrospiraceae bacterium]